jgi:hypothetical protein
MRTYRSTSDLPFARRFKACVGHLIRFLRPRFSARVDQRPFDPEWGWSGRFVRNALLADAVKRADHETLRRYFTDYWSSATSVEFYEGYSHRFEDLFLRHHAVVAEPIARLLPDLGEGPIRLVEVGSGDGRVLEWLSQNLDGVAEFHGVDLNAREIAKCAETHRHSDRLHFHAGDLLDCLRAHPAPRTILVTNGGVLEYVLRDELLAIFAEFRELCSPCIVAITESVGTDHDLDREPQSYPYGHELAFSHNYPAILRESGFEIGWERNRPTQPGEENYPVRWYQLVARGMGDLSRKLAPERLSAFLFTATQVAGA